MQWIMNGQTRRIAALFQVEAGKPIMTTPAAKSPTLAPSQVRILVADDHEVMRMGIRNLLEAHANWTVCAEARDGCEAVAQAIKSRPDVIIMDVTMPAMNGLDAATSIAQAGLDIPVILFSLHVSENLTNNLTWSGIRGAVNKSNAARDLIEAIETVLQGGTFFPYTEPLPSRESPTAQS
jgi:DNA-binding NarL/FixJ family response regulator